MKKFLCVLMCFVMILSLCACGNSNQANTAEETAASTNDVMEAVNEIKDEVKEKVEEVANIVDSKSAEELYEEILNEYTVKLQEATPKLIEEYKVEAIENNSGLEGLAKIANDKVGELAEISNDGISEMAKIMMTKGSGSYSDYEEWAMKLMDVYTEEASKIMDAYMKSV